MMKFIPAFPALLLAVPLSSCVGVNAIVNVEQDIRMDSIEGVLFLHECRYLAGAEEAASMLAREGSLIVVDLEELGLKVQAKDLPSLEVRLLPTAEGWSFLNAMASSVTRQRRLDWACASDLVRLGQVDLTDLLASFSQVPDGEYFVYAHYSQSGVSGGTLRPQPTVLRSKLEVQSSEQGPRVEVTPLASIPREDVGRVNLESRR